MTSRIRRAAIAVVATALVIVAAPSALAGGGGETVGVKDFDFGPKTAKISKGDKVKWVNQEGSHTVTFKNGFNEVLSSEGESTNRRFKKAGTYEYICSFHDDQGMKGKVVVR